MIGIYRGFFFLGLWGTGTIIVPCVKPLPRFFGAV